jgi:hypothetical protein
MSNAVVLARCVKETAGPVPKLTELWIPSIATTEALADVRDTKLFPAPVAAAVRETVPAPSGVMVAGD